MSLCVLLPGVLPSFVVSICFLALFYLEFRCFLSAIRRASPNWPHIAGSGFARCVCSASIESCVVCFCVSPHVGPISMSFLSCCSSSRVFIRNSRTEEMGSPSCSRGYSFCALFWLCVPPDMRVHALEVLRPIPFVSYVTVPWFYLRPPCSIVLHYVDLFFRYSAARHFVSVVFMYCLYLVVLF